MSTFFKFLLVFMNGLLLQTVFAQGEEALIRKTLKERMPHISPIDEIKRTPMPGLFELRVDSSEIYYTDASANFLIQGRLIDTKNQRDLTEERIQKIMAVDFKSLPVKDAIVIVRGKGERRMAIFEDPNCGYCKRFEKDLQKLENVTIYHLLYPILGEDSRTKSKNIWCSNDKLKAWDDLEWLNSQTDGWWRKNRMEFDNLTTKKASVKIKTPQGVEVKGYESLIGGIIVDNPEKVRGGRGELLVFEEAGSFKNLKKARLSVVSPVP